MLNLVVGNMMGTQIEIYSTDFTPNMYLFSSKLKKYSVKM